MIKAICILIVLSISPNTYGQSIPAETISGKSMAEQELGLALTNKPQNNIIDNKTAIIKDSLTAITMAEYILFDIYGRDNITRQRPYETYLINNYWVITGTKPKEYKGGVFLIIIDSRNSKIVKLTHGK